MTWIDAAVGGGVVGTSSSSSPRFDFDCTFLSAAFARLSRSFNDGAPPTELKRSEKSAAFSENRMGGSAGAINVAREVRSTGEDSDGSSDSKADEERADESNWFALPLGGSDIGGGGGALSLEGGGGGGADSLEEWR